MRAVRAARALAVAVVATLAIVVPAIVVLAPPAHAQTVALTPSSSTGLVGNTHTVLVTFAQSGDLRGELIDFEVTQGPNEGTGGTCVPSNCFTDSNGQVSFTYLGDGGPGVDLIEGCSDGGDSIGKCGGAQRTWTVPTTTSTTTTTSSTTTQPPGATTTRRTTTSLSTSTSTSSTVSSSTTTSSTVPPDLTFDPESLVPGGDVTAMGEGCPADSEVELRVGSRTVGEAEADGDGEFEAPLDLGALRVGRQLVVAECGDVTLRAPLDLVVSTSGAASTGTAGAAAAVLCFFVLLAYLLTQGREGGSRTKGGSPPV